MKPHDAKVLIVEDEVIVSLDIQTILKDMGIAVTGIAHTVEQALASIAGERPDLVLLDISLDGEFEGVELARTIDRSEERRVGKECATLCRSRWSPYH